MSLNDDYLLQISSWPNLWVNYLCH